MESIITISDRLVEFTNCTFNRYLADEIAWNNRLIGIIGAKGAGKTTMLLQHIKAAFPDRSKALYASLDNVWFAKHGLNEVADYHYATQGRNS